MSWPGRRWTAATGTAPSRSSRHAHDARLDDPGVALERGADHFGLDLVPAPEDRLVGAPTMKRKPSASRRARSVVRTHSSVAELRGADFEQPDLVGSERGPEVGVDDPQRAPGVRAPDAAALGRAELLMIGEVPARHATAELGGAVRAEHGHAVPIGERVGEIGIERRGARDDRTDAGEDVVVDVGVEHHPQRGRHEADGLGPVPPHHVDPTVDGEAFEEGDAAAVEHRLHHAEDAAHVDQRRVDDDDAFAEADVGVGGALVVLGARASPARASRS